MTNSRIELTLGSFNFSCEGEKDWVEAQLSNILEKSLELRKLSERVNAFKPLAEKGQEGEFPKKRGRKPKSEIETYAGPPDPLVDFLKEKKAEDNQVRKFLATAVYLHSQGVELFSTPIISRKFKTAHIHKLVNASDCLNKNAQKGFIIKEDKEFVLTEEGIRSIIGIDVIMQEEVDETE